MKQTFLFFVVGLLASSCQTSIRCSDNDVFADGKCVPETIPRDTGVDASDASDASVDTAPIPCGGRCDESRCRALGDAGVPADTGVGDAGNTPDEMGRVCVECTSSGHCPSGSATPACNTDTFRCVECVDTSDCNNNANGTACISNKCGCDDAADCNGKACKPNGVCSAFGTDVADCTSCDTDRNCGSDGACVEHVFTGGVSLGYYCFPLANAACTTKRPYVFGDARSSIDNGTSRNLCLLKNTVSCDIIADVVSEPQRSCTIDTTDCGTAAVSDGTCIEYPTGPNPICSYACTVDTDCPMGRQCASASGTTTKYCR